MASSNADPFEYLATPEKEAATAARFRVTWQFKQAWKILEPDPQRRAKCEGELVFALVGVENAREMDKKSGSTPGEQRKLLQKLAKTLRVAIDLSVQMKRGPISWRPSARSWDSRVEFLKRYRKEIEEEVDCLDKHEVKKGAPRQSIARMVAVSQAYQLLEKYGDRPTRYRDGPWHELARVLFGNEQADLFDYIEQYR
jgi:hypothetical protein